ncbi:hypothetical protein predicted by Glimmer/Critica [Acetobacter senegalensis]|uniref:Uncharacterized protein n=1 Tax=Acetobacter senegalensis TaxID=446692 RepID=A0A0U5F060_9PROT|nr:hypothetical protein predicted by Glimmer/Critica [Acetobacter senegalensis]
MLGSAGFDMVGVTGSIPVAPTIFDRLKTAISGVFFSHPHCRLHAVWHHEMDPRGYGIRARAVTLWQSYHA